MLQVNFIRENKTLVTEGLKKRNFNNPEILDEILKTDDLRKQSQRQLDDILAQSNKAAKEIGALMQQGKREEAEKAKTAVAELKAQSNQLKEQLNQANTDLENLLFQVPNQPNALVPAGNTDEDNEVFKAWDKPMPTLPEGSQPHWELTKKYDIIDFELGVKITGAGFPVYKGQGARLQRALIQFFLDEAIAAGYVEYIPPLIVNEASGRGTGSLPDKEGQMYYIGKDDFYLIPTAEVPVTNIYRDVILDTKDFPVKMCSYTPCFRREAGSYGAHVRGLNRLHQFDKVEIVRLEHPDRSYAALDEMLAHVEMLLGKLELPFRILRLCGGDLSFASALTYDFEIYSAAQERWLEVSSVSNFETFQSNRMKCRYKDENRKNHLVHTLNGSALALPRIVAGLLENHQTPEGIVIPKALRPYTGFDMIK